MSHLNIVNVPFLCARGKGWEKGVPVHAAMSP